MSCCGTDFSDLVDGAPNARPSPAEVRLASRSLGEDVHEIRLSVPSAHCGQCIRTIERGLSLLPQVEEARVNLTTKRVAVRWRGETPPLLFDALAKLGYQAFLLDAEEKGGDVVLGRLVRALAVAGFAAGNIMMLSMAVWSGAEGETRDLFHWLSALIALPALAYAGRVFFGSAWQALRRGRTNMDVPISLGVILAFAMSLYDTLNHGEHAYFDAATSLLFFLLVGRTLDHMMREKARNAVAGLSRMSPRGAVVVRPNGRRDYLPLPEIEPGMTLLVAAGERVPVDARVEQGASELDNSLVTGESLPYAVAPGSILQSGVLNLSGPLLLTATARAQDSLLAEMIRMMDAAEGSRSAYRRVADRAAALYAPAVHLMAIAALVGWGLATGDMHRAVTIAIAVLIITCPCALGLAVPMVQVMAARRLFESGIMVKDGSALERIAEADTALFDKTGTLTAGVPRLANRRTAEPSALAVAAAMAAHSGHPYSRALAAGANPARLAFHRVEEKPGMGLEAWTGETRYRLGRAEWVLEVAGTGYEGTVLSRDGRFVEEFRFEDRLREGARQALAALENAGMASEIVSGDREAIVGSIAGELGIGRYTAGATPADKIARVEALRRQGRKVLMVGDGLNDAPALAAAHVSMAPASAADIGRSAADFVFLRESLEALPLAIAIARRAGQLVRQNFALAIGYNMLAVPFAVAGYVTPLAAAVAMSLSSILVVANSLRLGAGTGAPPIGLPQPQLGAPQAAS